MLEKFVAFIDQEKWDLDSIQIAEVLWFVRQVSPLVPEIDQNREPPKPIQSSSENGKQVIIFALYLLIESGLYRLALLLLPDKIEPQKQVPPPPQYPLTIPPPSTTELPTQTPIEQNYSTAENLPIKLPDTGIFRNTLALSRLTKPLKQKINSRIAHELDVKQTVKLSAELSTPKKPYYFPVKTPKKERWLDVVLVIEDSDSMILWQSLLKEVQAFLEHLGAFRDIKSYRMNWDNLSETCQLYPNHYLSCSPSSSYLISDDRPFSSSCSLSTQQLNVPDGRRLILMVSDCLSPAWINDKFTETLKEWSSKGLLTLLNPFPERMWERTNLDYAIKIRLGNQLKGLPTQKWQAIPLESWQIKKVNTEPLVKLPILSLEPESMAAWVNVMMGKGTSLCSGVWLGRNKMYTSLENEINQAEEILTTVQQINYFYATASEKAWQLIQYLSAIPISLSTIRLVQRTLVPDSTQVNVAEVVMGGLLSPLQPLDFYQSPQQIQFEFKEGIREEFLNSLGKGEFCLAVIGSLTEKIASHFGYQTVKEFEGVLIDKPLELSQEDDLELIQVFATISVSTLRQYGAEYAPYIRKLDRSRARLNLGSAINQNARDYNWIDFLEEQAKKHNLTEVQTETLINLFPTPQKSCSVSDVAKQFLCSVSNIRKRLSRIYGKFESLNPSFFQPKRSAKLSTLQQYLSSQYVKICLLRQSAIPADAISQLETLELFEFEADVAIIVDKSVPEPQSEPQSSDKKLDQLTFETPTVNRSGEIIKTTTHTASYFTEKLANDVDLEMVAIPGGTFTMGSPESEKDSYDDERPQHNVTVSPFFMGKYPITQGQWKEIAQRTDLKINIDLDEDPSNFKKPYQDQDREIDRWQRPVEQVNWYEAVEFCQRLSKLTRRDYRLPSEAQWEYACRSQKSEVRSQKSELTIAQWNEKYNQPFYFGETITADLVNYRASSTYADEPNGEYRSQTTPVGQFPPNAFGLYDMHGNVWEWCQDDWHDNYDGAPTDGSAWIDGNEDENSPQENSLESRENDENLNQENDLKSSENDENQPNTVLRGGSWLNDPVNCRSAYRFYFYPREDRIGNSGFRVVCVFGSG